MPQQVEQPNEMQVFLQNWRFSRRLTMDLLETLSPKDLLWSPAERVGPFWKQFRHVGRVQENYLESLNTGAIRFCCDDVQYSGGPNRDELASYLSQLDASLTSALSAISGTGMIDWFGEDVPLMEHLQRLLGHETLHHGQWIVYCKLLGREFPPSWSAWGLSNATAGGDEPGRTSVADQSVATTKENSAADGVALKK